METDTKGNTPARICNCTYAVHELGQTQPLLRANDWRSPLICRVSCSTEYVDGGGEVTLDCKEESHQEQEYAFALNWQGMGHDFKLCLNSYQDAVLTEYAALGLCCIAVREVLNKDISRVTRRGERADFWIGNKECLLEVSGQQSGNLETLRDKKAEQLLANPMEKSGYVSVTDFQKHHSYLWYYEVADES